jgi:hypothetical protein
MNYLPGVASNCDPTNLSLQSSWDCRYEPLTPNLELEGHGGLTLPRSWPNGYAQIEVLKVGSSTRGYEKDSHPTLQVS